jgi:hypothetical protein
VFADRNRAHLLDVAIGRAHVLRASPRSSKDRTHEVEVLLPMIGKGMGGACGTSSASVSTMTSPVVLCRIFEEKSNFTQCERGCFLAASDSNPGPSNGVPPGTLEGERL